MICKRKLGALTLMLPLLWSGTVYAQSVEEFDSVKPDKGSNGAAKSVSQADLSKTVEMIVEQTNAFREKNKFVEGWKNSEGHRENMLDPHIYETGVAVAKSEEKPQYFAVQMFGRPHSKAIRFQITNRADKEVEYTVSRKNDERSFKLPPLATRTRIFHPS